VRGKFKQQQTTSVWKLCLQLNASVDARDSLLMKFNGGKHLALLFALVPNALFSTLLTLARVHAFLPLLIADDSTVLFCFLNAFLCEIL
jgi:hypothetical protein